MRILVILFLLISCRSQDIPKGNSGLPQSEVEIIGSGLGRRSTSVCLRDLLVGEDSGGTWTLISPTGPFNPTLTGDNPCVDFSTAPGGLYTFRYTITTLCCAFYTDGKIRKCAITGTSTCNF